VEEEQSCVFCRIVDGDEPAQILYASDSVMAFRDVAPQAPVHVQLIPKEHLTSIAEVEEHHGGVLADLFLAGRQVARAEGIDDAGWRLVTNVGREGGPIHRHAFAVAGHLACGEHKRRPGFEVRFAALNRPSADLDPLQVGQDRDRAPGASRHPADEGNGAGMVVVGSVREVEARHVHAGHNHGGEGCLVARGRPDRSYDAYSSNVRGHRRTPSLM